MDINTAIKIVRKNATDKYAKQYLSVLPEVIDEGGKHGLAVQLLYILENCKSWKGTEAVKVKSYIKTWISKNAY